MLCVAAFVVLLVLGAFSAKYRRLLRQAWGCTWRRATLRPCDTGFRDDVKNRLLAPVALRTPRLVGAASVGIEVVAWVMVLTLVVSLYIVARSGLNLLVYGTCDKQSPQSCTLAATQCSIDAIQPSFGELMMRGDVIGAVGGEAASLGDTIAAVPSRLRDWQADDYTTRTPTYLTGRDEQRPTALEVLDPGCQFCAQLFRAMRSSGFDATHNVTYLAYAIGGDANPKFANSPLVVRYLAAMRDQPPAAGLDASGASADWQVLKHLFTDDEPTGGTAQAWMNRATPEQARERLHTLMLDAGYTAEEVASIAAAADGDDVATTVAADRDTVETRIRTVSIPSLIADGRLHSGAVSADDLRGMR